MQGRLDYAVEKYIGKYIEKRNMEVELHIGDNVIETITAVFGKIHEWKPDWLAIWNIKFDKCTRHSWYTSNSSWCK